MPEDGSPPASDHISIATGDDILRTWWIKAVQEVRNKFDATPANGCRISERIKIVSGGRGGVNFSRARGWIYRGGVAE